MVQVSGSRHLVIIHKKGTKAGTKVFHINAVQLIMCSSTCGKAHSPHAPHVKEAGGSSGHLHVHNHSSWAQPRVALDVVCVRQCLNMHSGSSLHILMVCVVISQLQHSIMVHAVGVPLNVCHAQMQVSVHHGMC